MSPNHNPTMRIISLIVLACFLSSCAMTVPERFATLEEVYPPNASLTPPRDAPPDSLKKSIFEAPYEDVFRAVNVAASQAQFNVESTDKRKGLILATRVIMVPNPNRSYGQTSEPRTYFYAVLVKEVGPKVSEVMALAKVQQSCTRNSGFSMTLLSIISFGAYLVLVPQERICDSVATVRWATGEYTTMQEMTQLLTFTRNNLIAAGAL